MLETAIQAFYSTLEDAGKTAQFVYRSGVHYIVSGSFKSKAIYLLAFDPVARTLDVTSHQEAFGPHQYLALNQDRSRVYATTWATPPLLSAWSVERPSEEQAPSLSHLGNVNIPAVSSYVSVLDSKLYSAGGHYAEVHALAENGSIDEKLQQLYYLPESELANADKTRKALRVGSHGFDVTKDGKAFVPHLGRNSIYMYEVDTLGVDGELHLLDEVISPRPEDGPRHVWPHPDGKLLYSITEHSNFIDVYEIKARTLKHVQSGQIVPQDKDPHKYRGNTLRLSRDQRFIFGSTRGSSPDIHGYVAAFELDDQGYLKSETAIAHYEMPTSGGIAGAIEPAFWKGSEGMAAQDYILLVDEEKGSVNVIGWSGGIKKFQDVAQTTLPEGATASHALWLS